MIDFLRGSVVVRDADSIVIDVNGVGYRVFCANPFAIRPGEREETTVFIHYHVREDAVQLFGFGTREEQDLFRKLIEVNGIGPRVALGILSGGNPAAVAAAIQREDLAFLTKLPGIGKKTAQRMVLDLKDKMGAFPADPAPLQVAAGTEPAPQTADGSAWPGAKEALLALGYTEAEADRVGAMIRPSAPGDASVDQLLKLALKSLYRG